MRLVTIYAIRMTSRGGESLLRVTALAGCRRCALRCGMHVLGRGERAAMRFVTGRAPLVTGSGLVFLSCVASPATG